VLVACDDTLGVARARAVFVPDRSTRLTCGCTRLAGDRPGPAGGDCPRMEVLTGCVYHPCQVLGPMVEVGDTVRLDVDDWATARNAIGLVTAVDEVPDEPHDRMLTVQTTPGGETYWLLGDVVRIDMPRVEPGQVWACDQTGTVVRVRERSWYCPLAWETTTIGPAWRHVGTVVLTPPAWRLVEDADPAALIGDALRRAIAQAKERVRCLCGHLRMGHGASDTDPAVIGAGPCGGGPVDVACGRRCQQFRPARATKTAPQCTTPGHGRLPLVPIGAQTADEIWCGVWYRCHICGSVQLTPSPELVEHLGWVMPAPNHRWTREADNLKRCDVCDLTERSYQLAHAGAGLGSTGRPSGRWGHEWVTGAGVVSDSRDGAARPACTGGVA
jgi:hypothetical protein